MSSPLDGPAIVYCQGAYRTSTGKTAHGLVRFTRRYKVVAVVDGDAAPGDAGEVLDGQARGIPLVADLAAALAAGEAAGAPATHFVLGMAPEGGRLAGHARAAVLEALAAGLHVDAGLHDYLEEDPEVAALAAEKGCTLRDVRRPPPRSALHAFTGKIREVTSFRVAVLGTDSAVGKRTTAWRLVDAFRARGRSAEMVGSGQTAWLQGARYGVRMDGLINDFVAGEVEHAVHSAWAETGAEVLVLEGQGSMLNPIFPGGFELVCASKPHAVVLQHAPARQHYNMMEGFPVDPLPVQRQVVELVSRAPVVALTVNREGLDDAALAEACARLEDETGLPAANPLTEDLEKVVDALEARRAEVEAAAGAGAAPVAGPEVEA